MPDYYPTTQQAHPWRATARTILAVALPAAAAVPAIVEAITNQDPGAVGGLLGGVVAAAGAITRLMAVPYVDHLLCKIGLGSAPKAEMVPGETVELDPAPLLDVSALP